MAILRPRRRQRRHADPDPDKPDHLSRLPDEVLITILSFLPTRIAARTSLVSRRFRNLWKACPSIDLTDDTISHLTFEAAANCAILGRQPSTPLLSLRLNVGYSYYRPNTPFPLLSSLLLKARSLGLRHLTLTNHFREVLDPMIPTIFSIHSLQSLHLFSDIPLTPSAVRSVVTLTQLQSLSFTLKPANSTEFNQLLSQLPSLQHLGLQLDFSGAFSLSSHTIRKLDLEILRSCNSKYEFLGLSVPSLEILGLKVVYLFQMLPRIEGDMPFLRKAAIQLHGLNRGYCLRKGDVCVVTNLLNCVSNAEELSLDLKESDTTVRSSIHLFLLYGCCRSC